jgi:hypothetical protein
MSEQPSPAEAPASAAETELERKLAEQRARLAAVPPWPGLLAACIVPVGTAIAFVLLGSELAESEKELERIQAGGLIGVGLGWVLAFLLALWVVRASGPQAKGTTFLQPVALGFLAKLFVLGVGTVLFAKPLAGIGHHEAYAICFAAVTFGFQFVFQAVYGSARQRVLRS